jgi:hypothetical protein
MLPLSPAEQKDSSMRRSQTSSPMHENPKSAVLPLSTCKATGFKKEVKNNSPVPHCCKSWRNISFPSDISELFHEDITTNILEKCSP